ncbi:MAG: glutamate--cysteine ligase [Burkholderiaceae bacterium]|jgi:glutamate--cysteine ligase|nr:glutamate--cysteine ligase [Burkholderiaceae bacterium]
MVPHLITALAGPLNELEQRVLDATPAIERWFRLEWMEHTPPIYAAIDIRNAGFKVAPTDANLYPTGWHNLAGDVMPLAVQAAQAAIEKICPEARNLLIVPENGAPGSFYLENLARLREIFGMAGLNVRFGSIDPALRKNQTYPLSGGGSIAFEPALRIGPAALRMGLKHFDPCTILLNNALAAGAPGILEDLYEQYLLPPLQAGWTVRRMSRHYQCHEEICKRFGKLLGIDPWLIHPLFAACGEIAPGAPLNAEALREQVNGLFSKIRRKYKEYGIRDKPFAVIKARGHLLHLAAVRDVKELDALLAHLPKGKNGNGKAARPGAVSSEILVQEGVPEAERINDAQAEPVVYTIDRHVIGGYYRVCAKQDAGERTRYVPLAFAGHAQLPRPAPENKDGAAAPNRFYLYGVVGRLALVAASYELEATDPQMLTLDDAV